MSNVVSKMSIDSTATWTQLTNNAFEGKNYRVDVILSTTGREMPAENVDSGPILNFLIKRYSVVANRQSIDPRTYYRWCNWLALNIGELQWLCHILSDHCRQISCEAMFSEDSGRPENLKVTYKNLYGKKVLELKQTRIGDEDKTVIIPGEAFEFLKFHVNEAIELIEKIDE